MAWTVEDSEKMEAAASEAAKELEELLEDEQLAPGIRALVDFHARWYSSAGHKRLGRMYVNAHGDKPLTR